MSPTIKSNKPSVSRDYMYVCMPVNGIKCELILLIRIVHCVALASMLSLSEGRTEGEGLVSSPHCEDKGGTFELGNSKPT